MKALREYPRSYETTIKRETTAFFDEGLETPNGACLFEKDQKVAPYMPGCKFLGFVAGNIDEGRAVVNTRGAVVLKIAGATDEDRGRTVYATGENAFSLKKGGVPIGMIRHCENERCSVAFKRPGDERPLDLIV